MLQGGGLVTASMDGILDLDNVYWLLIFYQSHSSQCTGQKHQLGTWLLGIATSHVQASLVQAQIHYQYSVSIGIYLSDVLFSVSFQLECTLSSPTFFTAVIFRHYRYGPTVQVLWRLLVEWLNTLPKGTLKSQINNILTRQSVSAKETSQK